MTDSDRHVRLKKMFGHLFFKEPSIKEFGIERCVKKVEGHINTGPFNPRLFNRELFNPGLFNREFLNNGVENFMVENTGVEMSSHY